MQVVLWMTAAVLFGYICHGKDEIETESDILMKITSGHDEVVKFATAINFYIHFSNQGYSPYKMTAIPTQCCLEIEKNDIDCTIMELGRPGSVNLAAEGENATARINFMFRNLYARYRVGNCSFMITAVGRITKEWQHTIKFNTFPVSSSSNATTNCTGIDQDPDRNCTPVDCAIKYKGKRSFYRNSTGKCEPVVRCNTRSSKDGITVTGYYDWDENVCVDYEWFANENFFKQVESDTEIPESIPALPKSRHYPDLEPNLVKELMDSGEYKLECNHGNQDGIHCKCEEGWISSGLHRDSPLKFNWCDTRMSVPDDNAMAPRKLGEGMEVFLIVILSIVNLALLVAWPYVLAKLVCPSMFSRSTVWCRVMFYYCYNWRKQE